MWSHVRVCNKSAGMGFEDDLLNTSTTDMFTPTPTVKLHIKLMGFFQGSGGSFVDSFSVNKTK